MIDRLVILSVCGCIALSLFGSGVTRQAEKARAATINYSMRFYGTGSGDTDRVKIAIDAQNRPVDIGGDMTIEFWMLALSGSNTSASCKTGKDQWINGNTIIDRDIFGALEYGDYGISLYGGRIAFGVARSTGGASICSTTDLRTGNWHHVAVTRSTTTGSLRIFVNGKLEASGNGPIGDISYKDGRPTNYPNSDPYLVIGAEKHDVGSAYPSFNGWIDDLRISNTVRYTTNFSPPIASLGTDAQTVALYNFNEGTGTVLNDSSGTTSGPSNGVVRYNSTLTRPSWSALTPWNAPPTPTSTATLSNTTAIPTATPDYYATATAYPFHHYLPAINTAP